VRYAGELLVASISCDDGCYAAGDADGFYILSHNIGSYLKP
jgi:hypothetical protein